MRVKSTEIVDTFAEAFSMWGARVIVTAATRQWSQAAAQSMTGFATSVIGCKCEAGIERFLAPEETPDRRPGVSILLFAMDKASVGKRLLERIGQCIMTCPTTACFNGLDGEETVQVGSQLRYFGDGFQGSKKLAERRFWRIPVMDGEFTVEESFAVRKSVGGGNIIILGTNEKRTLAAGRRRNPGHGRHKGILSCRSPTASCAAAARWDPVTRPCPHPPTTPIVRR